MKLIKYTPTTGQRCLSFSDDVKLWQRWGSTYAESRVVESLFQLHILPELSVLQRAGSQNLRYPWCFIAPLRQKKKASYICGAFLPAQPPNDEADVVLYTATQASFLTEDGEHCVSLSFWLARALAGVADRTLTSGHKTDLREACRPLAGKLIARQRSYIWLSEPRCDADFEFEQDNGVDFMPWADWPHCIQNDDNIWLWRKTRHGKITDSIKIPTIRDIAHSV